MDGFLNLNKPVGLTSRRVVDRAERLVRPAKAGHAGTLDPLATGVLVVAVGRATRLIQYLHRRPKSYTATFLLGRSSDTEDIEGEIRPLVAPPIPTREELAAGAKKLTGQIAQRPPQYSALRVQGRRAYELARRGQRAPLAARSVTIHRIQITRYLYPELTIEVDCSTGTYVRSLGRDLAEAVGTAAVMSALVRTAVGDFQLQNSLDPAGLTAENLPAHLLPPLAAIGWMPRIELSDEEVRRVRRGQAVHREHLDRADQEYAGVDAKNDLVAILATKGPGLLSPVCTLHAEG